MHYTRKQNAILVCMHVHASMTKYGGIKKLSTNSVTACLGGLSHILYIQLNTYGNIIFYKPMSLIRYYKE